MNARSIGRRAPVDRFKALYPCVCLAGLLSGSIAMAAPVDDALVRPALIITHAAQSNILGVATAGLRTIAVGERGIILVSEDGARSWRQVPSPISVTLTSVRFADSQNGVAVGHGGTVLTTSDGGLNWQVRLDGRKAAEMVLAAAQTNGQPRTLRLAEQLVADGPDKPFLDAAYLSNDKVLVVGAYGLAFISEDAGATWSPFNDRLNNPQGLHLYAIRAKGNEVLIVGEQGLIFRSGDMGASFQKLSPPYAGSFFTAEILSDRSVLVAGLKGNTWHGAADGSKWQKVETGQAVSITASQISAEGTVLLANQAGEILQLEGSLARRLETPSLPPVSGIFTTADGSTLLATVNGVVRIPEIVSNHRVSQ